MHRCARLRAGARGRRAADPGAALLTGVLIFAVAPALAAGGAVALRAPREARLGVGVQRLGPAALRRSGVLVRPLGAQTARRRFGPAPVHGEGEAAPLLDAEVDDVDAQQDGGDGGHPQQGESADGRHDRAHGEREEEQHRRAPPPRASSLARLACLARRPAPCAVRESAVCGRAVPARSAAFVRDRSGPLRSGPCWSYRASPGCSEGRPGALAGAVPGPAAPSVSSGPPWPPWPPCAGGGARTAAPAARADRCGVPALRTVRVHRGQRFGAGGADHGLGVGEGPDVHRLLGGGVRVAPVRVTVGAVRGGGAGLVLGAGSPCAYGSSAAHPSRTRRRSASLA